MKQTINLSIQWSFEMIHTIVWALAYHGIVDGQHKMMIV